MIHNIEQQPQLRQTRVDDAFWNDYQNLILEQVIPYQEQILRDQIPDIERSHAIENFRIAAGRSEGEFYGMVFQDSDLAKWMEAVSNAMAIRDNPELVAKADEMIALIGEAQEPDGYLDTYFQIKEPGRKWMNLMEAHELYCMGHMIEAAVAHYESTGDDSFLSIGCRMADCIDARFGKDKMRGVPGHPEIEIALMRLYHATKEGRHLALARYFIDERGTEPNYFAAEAEHKDFRVFDMDPNDRGYMQNDRPVREMSEATGHAVRAVYLYTAMADLAAEIGDEALYEACERLWNNVTGHKMYITGGVGSTGFGEAFTVNDDLPNDTGYAETCASVAMVFWAREMLQMHTDRRYADVMERELYNGVLSGMQHDGKRFFYVNPLEVDPHVTGVLADYRHVLPERPQWYACACCPPNVARLITALSRYAWGENEETIYAHLYLGGTYTSQTIPSVSLQVESAYPMEGQLRYTVATNPGQRSFTLAIRIPAWAQNVHLTRDGRILDADSLMADGYVYLEGMCVEGECVTLTFDLPVRRIYANTRVRLDAGLVAVMRGPMVYAAEQIDNGAGLYNLALLTNAPLIERRAQDDRMGDYIEIRGQGVRYAAQSDDLYSDTRPQPQPQELVLVPYYLWGNRGGGEMRVWMREEVTPVR